MIRIDSLSYDHRQSIKYKAECEMSTAEAQFDHNCDICTFTCRYPKQLSKHYQNMHILDNLNVAEKLPAKKAAFISTSESSRDKSKLVADVKGKGCRKLSKATDAELSKIILIKPLPHKEPKVAQSSNLNLNGSSKTYSRISRSLGKSVSSASIPHSLALIARSPPQIGPQLKKQSRKPCNKVANSVTKGKSCHRVNYTKASDLMQRSDSRDSREPTQKKSQYQRVNINHSQEDDMKSSQRKCQEKSKTNGFIKLECRFCSFVATDPQKIKQHVAEVHKKIYRCSSCTFVTDNKHKQFVHRSVHRESAIFTCTECSYSSAVKGSFDKHYLHHTTQAPFRCYTCSYSSSFEGVVRRHILIHHQRLCNDDDNDNVFGSQNDNCLRQDHCLDSSKSSDVDTSRYQRCTTTEMMKKKMSEVHNVKNNLSLPQANSAHDISGRKRRKGANNFGMETLKKAKRCKDNDGTIAQNGAQVKHYQSKSDSVAQQASDNRKTSNKISTNKAVSITGSDVQRLNDDMDISDDMNVKRLTVQLCKSVDGVTTRTCLDCNVSFTHYADMSKHVIDTHSVRLKDCIIIKKSTLDRHSRQSRVSTLQSRLNTSGVVRNDIGLATDRELNSKGLGFENNFLTVPHTPGTRTVNNTSGKKLLKCAHCLYTSLRISNMRRHLGRAIANKYPCGYRPEKTLRVPEVNKLKKEHIELHKQELLLNKKQFLKVDSVDERSCSSADETKPSKSFAERNNVSLLKTYVGYKCRKSVMLSPSSINAAGSVLQESELKNMNKVTESSEEKITDLQANAADKKTKEVDEIHVNAHLSENNKSKKLCVQNAAEANPGPTCKRCDCVGKSSDSDLKHHICEKVYTCIYCLYKTRWRSDMKKHLLKLHSAKIKKPEKIQLLLNLCNKRHQHLNASASFKVKIDKSLAKLELITSHKVKKRASNQQLGTRTLFAAESHDLRDDGAVWISNNHTPVSKKTVVKKSKVDQKVPGEIKNLKINNCVAHRTRIRSSVIKNQAQCNMKFEMKCEKNCETDIAKPLQENNQLKLVQEESNRKKIYAAIQDIKSVSRFRPYKCSMCTKRSNWKWDVMKHIRTCHQTAYLIKLSEEEARVSYMSLVHKYIERRQLSGLPAAKKLRLETFRKRRSSALVNNAEMPTKDSEASRTSIKCQNVKSLVDEQIFVTKIITPVRKRQQLLIAAQNDNTSVDSQYIDKSGRPAKFIDKDISKFWVDKLKLKRFKCSHCPFRSNFRGDFGRHVRQQHKSKDCKVLVLTVQSATDTVAKYKICQSKQKRNGLHDANNIDKKYAFCGVLPTGREDKNSTNSLTSSDDIKQNYCDKVDNINLRLESSNAIKHSMQRDDVETTRTKIRAGTSDEAKCCSICPYVTDKSGHLKLHMTYHQPQPRNTYKCRYCAFFVRTARLLNRHIQLHLPKGEISTVAISKQVDTVSRVPRPTTTAKQKYNYICDQCPFVSFIRSDYWLHRRNHFEKPDMPYKCLLCSYWVDDKRLLTQHSLLHAAKYCPRWIPTVHQISSPESSPATDRLMTSSCRCAFVEDCHSHGISTIPLRCGTEMKCPFCSYSVASVQLMRQHYVGHVSIIDAYDTPLFHSALDEADSYLSVSCTNKDKAPHLVSEGKQETCNKANCLEVPLESLEVAPILEPEVTELNLGLEPNSNPGLIIDEDMPVLEQSMSMLSEVPEETRQVCAGVQDQTVMSPQSGNMKQEYGLLNSKCDLSKHIIADVKQIKENVGEKNNMEELIVSRLHEDALYNVTRLDEVLSNKLNDDARFRNKNGLNGVILHDKMPAIVGQACNPSIRGNRKRKASNGRTSKLTIAEHFVTEDRVKYCNAVISELREGETKPLLLCDHDQNSVVLRRETAAASATAAVEADDVYSFNSGLPVDTVVHEHSSDHAYADDGNPDCQKLARPVNQISLLHLLELKRVSND